MLINLSSFCIFAVYLANILCWAVAKYLLVNINEDQENQGPVRENSATEFNDWKGLEDDDVISLSSPQSLNSRYQFHWLIYNG